MIGSKDSYLLCDSDQLPIWCQAWYLQAVCGDRWDCRFIEKGGNVEAIWVFGLTKKMGFKSINFPTFLKYNGLFYAEEVKEDRYELLGMELMKSLPHRVKMSVEYTPGMHEKIGKVIQEFKDRAFAQKLRQTYVWDLRLGAKALLQGMDGNYRRMINKQKDVVDLVAASKKEAEELYDFHKDWVDDLGNHGVTRVRYIELIEALYDRHAGEVLNVRIEGKKIASVCVLYDKKKAYYLLAVNNKEYKKVYPAVLMAYEVAKYISEKGIEELDFLGSDLESISRVWRKLGAKKAEYLYMNKSHILPFK